MTHFNDASLRWQWKISNTSECRQSTCWNKYKIGRMLKNHTRNWKSTSKSVPFPRIFDDFKITSRCLWLVFGHFYHLVLLGHYSHFKLVKMAENGSLQQEQRQQWQAEAAKHQEYENNLVSLRKDIVKNHEKIIGIMQDLHGQVCHSEKI